MFRTCACACIATSGALGADGMAFRSFENMNDVLIGMSLEDGVCTINHIIYVFVHGVLLSFAISFANDYYLSSN